MNYFDELLESYDQIKKRKFKIRLSEESSLDPAAEQKATAVRAQAESMNPPPTYQQPFEAIPGKLVVFVTKKGVWHFASLSANGSISFQKKLDQDWPTFVGYFSDGGEEGSDPQQEQQLQPVPGDAIKASPYGHLEDVVKAFQNIGGRSQAIYGVLNDFEKQRGFFGKSPGAFNRYLVLGAKESIEAQVATAKSIRIDENGKAEYGKLTDDLITGSVRTFDKFTDILTKTDLGDDAKRDIEKMVAINSDGSFTIFHEFSTDEGLVFNDNTGFLKTLSAAATRIHSANIEVIPITKKAKVNEVIHGVTLEKVLSLFAATKHCLNAQDKNHPNANEICRASKNLVHDFIPELAKLKAGYENFEKTFKEGHSAVSLEDKRLIDAISLVLGKNTQKTVETLLRISEDSINTRNPDYVAHVGGITKIGVKTDNREIWINRESAVEGLRNQGFSEEDANEIIKGVSVEQAFHGDHKGFKYAMSTGELKPGQLVFTHSLNLKNYRDLSAGKMGENRLERIDDFIQGGPSDNPALRKIINESLGVKDSMWPKASEYSSSMMDIDSKIRSMPVEAFATASDGEQVKTTPVEDMARSMVSILMKNSEYKQLVGDTNESQLISMLKSASKGADKNTEERLKERLSSYIRNKKAYSDSLKGNKSAKYYLASKAFILGGDLDKNQTCDWRGLMRPGRYVFNQNKAVAYYLKKWINNEPGVAVQMTKSGIRWSDPMNPKSALILQEEGEAGSGSTRASRAVLKIGEGLMDKMSVRKSITNESVLRKVVSAQSKLFTLLLNLGRNNQEELENPLVNI